MATALRRRQTEPGPGARTCRAGGLHFRQHRSQQVDRHEHVAWQCPIRAVGFQHEQTANAEQLAVAVEERRPAVIGNGRAGEDRLFDVVFPVARERARPDEPREAHLGAAAAARCDQERLPRLQRGDAGERHRLDTAQRHQGPNQAESRGEVVGHLARRQDALVLGDDLDGFRLEQQVADGEDQPVRPDHHARTRPRLAQAVGRGGAFRRCDIQRDHGITGTLECTNLRVHRGAVGRQCCRYGWKSEKGDARREQTAEPSSATARNPTGPRRSDG